MSSETPTREQLLAAYAAEEAELTALLARIPDAAWQTIQREDGWTIHDIVCHIADGASGIPRLVLEGPPPAGFDLNTLNEQRRQQNCSLPRPEVEGRLKAGFAAARSAAEQAPELAAPGPFGPDRTVGQWLQIIALHSAGHRQEIEQLLPEM